MPRKKHSAEEIIGKLREAEVLLARGKIKPEVSRIGQGERKALTLVLHLFQHRRSPSIGDKQTDIRRLRSLSGYRGGRLSLWICMTEM